MDYPWNTSSVGLMASVVPVQGGWLRNLILSSLVSSCVSAMQLSIGPTPVGELFFFTELIGLWAISIFQVFSLWHGNQEIRPGSSLCLWIFMVLRIKASKFGSNKSNVTINLWGSLRNKNTSFLESWKWKGALGCLCGLYTYTSSWGC